MGPENAERLAREWVEAWNAHDLERILSHYAEDVEFASPFVAAILGDGRIVRVQCHYAPR